MNTNTGTSNCKQCGEQVDKQNLIFYTVRDNPEHVVFCSPCCLGKFYNWSDK